MDERNFYMGADRLCLELFGIWALGPAGLTWRCIFRDFIWGVGVARKIFAYVVRRSGRENGPERWCAARPRFNILKC